MAQQDYFDIVIIGAGVIGLAIARQLIQQPGMTRRSLLIIDQERGFGQHTSSRNSEVIHAGIYYPAGSLKARLCVRGKELLYDYCRRQDIAHRQCGKLIVAQTGEESQLETLHAQAQANGVDDLEVLGPAQISALEPDIRGSAALLSPSTGIIDSHGLMQALLQEAEQGGALFAPLTKVTAIHRSSAGYELQTQASDGKLFQDYRFRCGALINCAGLWASAIADMLAKDCPADHDPGKANASPADDHLASKAFPPHTFWCKGDYFSYQGPARFQRLVYPLPEPGTRGLGVHATLDLANQVRFGPDSHYESGDWSPDPPSSPGSPDYPHSSRSPRSPHYEVNAAKAELFAAAISRYLPGIRADQLQPAYAGVRPKLAGPGQPAADFLIATGNGGETDSELHLLGIESPGLTASLALAEAASKRLLLN